MNAIIDFTNATFKPLVDMGASAIMLAVLTITALCLRAKFSKALEGGMKLAAALTAIGDIMNLLTTNFALAMNQSVKNIGMHKGIMGIGWASLATVIWGSPYTLYFLLVLIILNVLTLIFKRTDTLDVDIFDVWHLAFVGLLTVFCGAPFWLATLLILLIGYLRIVNSSLMKSTFDNLLGAPSSSPMATTHTNYVMSPVIMVFNEFLDKYLPWLGKYDFDSAKLGEEIGLRGSHFTIGVYLGVSVSLFAGYNLTTERGWKTVFTLSFIAGARIKLFSVIGSWSIASIESLSQGISNFVTSKSKGRTLNVGLDWSLTVGRIGIWAATNVLAPVMMVEAVVIPGNRLMSLGGIIAMGVTPASLIVTRGKTIGMIIIGTTELPIFLWVGTLVASFVTQVAHQVGTNIPAHTLVSDTTMGGPIEKFLDYLVGNAWKRQGVFIVYAILAIAAYILIFWWYSRETKEHNAKYTAAAREA